MTPAGSDGTGGGAGSGVEGGARATEAEGTRAAEAGRARWRLLVHGEADGPTNMAIDEALLRRVAARQSAPTLRFYRWRPATVSIGYFQRAAEHIDEAACRREGLGLVRRPTGGRALLHADEVTYSITIPEAGALLPTTVMESYRMLSEGLAAGLEQLGIRTELERDPDRGAIRPGSGSAACFAAPSWYELTVNGKKLVGSSQVRRYGGLLQHGSIPIRTDVRTLADVLRLRDEESRARLAERLSRKSTSIEAALQSPAPPFETIAAAIARGLGARLGVHWEVGQLTEDERALARRLRRDRYATESWTLSGPDRRRALPGAASRGRLA